MLHKCIITLQQKHLKITCNTDLQFLIALLHNATIHLKKSYNKFKNFFLANLRVISSQFLPLHDHILLKNMLFQKNSSSFYGIFCKVWLSKQQNLMEVEFKQMVNRNTI